LTVAAEPPAAGGAAAGPGDLAAIVFSGDFERVHYALVLATSAAAIGGRAVLFFTGDAVRALVADDGWRRLPTGGGAFAAEVDDRYRRQGVAGFAELIEAAGALEVRLICCEMALRVLGLTTADLRRDLAIERAGVVTLLADPAARRLVFV
jgi:peroxiredoxin family protein